MPEVKFEIVNHILSLKSTGKFRKELNIVSWGGREAVYDLRGWNEDHTQMTKGITFNKEEYEELLIKLKEE